jgi:sRNA-binding regulator protein Hfq
MKLRLILTLLIFSMAIKSANSQEKVNLLNGKVLEGTVQSTEDEKITMKVNGKKGKVYDTYLENYRVFSIISSDGTEKVIYKQDSSIGNFLEPKDMKFYTLGEQDAYKNYRPMGTMIIGTTLGLGLGIFDTYVFNDDPITTTVNEKGMFKESPGLLMVVYPFIYTALAGIAPRPQLDIHNITDRNNLNSEHFIQGFARVARYKRTIRALLFSAIGSAIGLGSYYIFK